MTTSSPVSCTAVVPFGAFGPPRNCRGCAGSSKDLPWAKYDTEYTPDCQNVVRRSPAGSGCEPCVEAARDVVAPAKMHSFDAFCDENLKDAKQTGMFLEYRARRQGKKSRFQKSDVGTNTRVAVRWIESYNSFTRAQFDEAHGKGASNVAGLPFHKVDDEHDEVVLVENPSRVEIVHTTEVSKYEFSLDHNNQLRPNQADEFWASVKQQHLKTRASPPSISQHTLRCLLTNKDGGGGAQSKPAASCFDEEEEADDFDAKRVTSDSRELGRPAHSQPQSPAHSKPPAAAGAPPARPDKQAPPIVAAGHAEPHPKRARADGGGRGRGGGKKGANAMKNVELTGAMSTSPKSPSTTDSSAWTAR